MEKQETQKVASIRDYKQYGRYYDIGLVIGALRQTLEEGVVEVESAFDLLPATVQDNISSYMSQNIHAETGNKGTTGGGGGDSCGETGLASYAEELERAGDEAHKVESVQYADSRDLAKIADKLHRMLGRDITIYCRELAQQKLDPADYFIESIFRNDSGNINKCYKVTRKGCEFIAAKLTGSRGARFAKEFPNLFRDADEAQGGQAAEPTDPSTKAVADRVAALERQSNDQSVAMDILRQELRDAVGSMRDAMAGKPADLADAPERVQGAGFCERVFQTEKSVTKRRMKELNSAVDEVAKAYGMERNRVLHLMYKTIEDKLDIPLNSYLRVYQGEVDRSACLFDVIVSIDRIYEAAIDMNRFAVSRKAKNSA